MMQYKGYVGSVEFDSEARILHGEVMGIRDVVTFQGDSVRQVERAFRKSVDDYLFFCRERGEIPDKPSSRGRKAVDQAQGRSSNAFVRGHLKRQLTAIKPSGTSVRSSSVVRKRQGRKKSTTHRS